MVQTPPCTSLQEEMSHQQPPIQDGPIPFFGGGNNSANRSGPPPRQQQQPFQQQQQQRPPFQPQPQRHPQQHPHQMQQQQQQGQQGFLRAQPPTRQMNQSPFAPAADLFASPPASNPNQNQNQAIPQGYQPQGGFPLAHGPPPPPQQQPQQQQQQQPPPQRSQSQNSPVLQKNQPPPPPKQLQQQQQQQQVRPPVQQQHPTPGQLQRNPQQQQHNQQQYPQAQQQQGFPSTQGTAPIPQTNSPLAPAADLFGNSTSQSASGWTIPSTAETSAVDLPTSVAPVAQQHAPVNQFPTASAPPPAVPLGRPPLPPTQLQKQPTLTQAQAQQAPPPQRQPTHQPVQQQVPQQPARQGSISAQGPPLGPPRNGPAAPGPHGPPQGHSTADRSTAQLPPPPRAMGTPRQGPLSAPLSASSHQGTSPYAGHAPPKTPLLTAIQTPLMLPAQTPQAYPSQTPYMGPLRNQFGSSSQLLLESCPFPECGGENKPNAKFCSECGRSISTASRSETPLLHSETPTLRSATPSLGHHSDFSGHASVTPNLNRMNSYTQEYQQQPDQQQLAQQQHQPEHQQQPETYQGYAQDGQNYQQQDQQYDYSAEQQVYDQGYDQGYGQGYEQGYEQHDQNYNQGYTEGTYYDQNQQQYYDPATGQYVDSYTQQEQVAEPEPEEEIIDDPLNRIHGCPLIAFGFGGKIVTAFPRSVQRFDSATSAMVTKRYPGEIRLTHIKDIVPVDRDVSTYPGPLLMDSSVQLKNKKKDVLKHIEDKIKEYEQDHQDSTFDAHRVLIWRLLKVMIEQDGALVGGPKVDEAVRSVLLSIPLSIYPAQPDQEPVSPIRSSASLDVLQDLLRNGDRSGAVRYAMSSNLWAHALVISSCVNKELWKEAVNGFVNQELMTGGGEVQANGREALRVLYALFSGQTQGAINELIPLNLRAPVNGDQNDAQPADSQFVTAESLAMIQPVVEPRIPGESLAQWRDTLIMILSNRTSGDQSAISSLGDTLLKEGWVEAAHICYLLSPQNSIHSGLDAQLNRLVLIGADFAPHAVFPFYKNIGAFQKTEIYEFACALKSSGATGGLPFLQAYKLIYIWTLVEWGMFSEAGRYLESVEAIVKSQTKGSPYYNIVFLERLKDITDRLTGSSQLAVAGESWFAKKVPKPTIGGIFDALDNKISKFIAGDNDQPKPEVVEPKANVSDSGPFANAPALPDLSNIPPRALSRSSNSNRAVNQAIAANDTRRPSGATLEVPAAYSEATAQADLTANPSFGQDQTLGYDGYDQSGQYNAEGYSQADANAGYDYQNQGYSYDANGNQIYDQTYQSGDATGYEGYDHQNQYQEQPEAVQDHQAENFQGQGGYEGQYEVQYDTQYNTQFDAQNDGQQGYDAFNADAVATETAPTTDDSTQAVHGSQKPFENGQAVAEVEAVAAVADNQQADNTSYNYTEGANYNGEYQSGEQQQGEQGYGEQQQYDQTYGDQHYSQGYDEQQYNQTYSGDQQYDQNYDQQQYNQTYGEQQYDQTAYQDQSQYQYIEGGDQGLGAEYSDETYQHQGELQHPVDHPAEVPAVAPETQALSDAPTYEQQNQVDGTAAAVEASTEVADGQHGDQQYADYSQGGQGEYQQEAYQQDYQQDHQQGEYQGEYQQGEYQQGEYQQGEYQQGEYQQGEYQQDEYQQGEYQQGEYQQGEYQQGEYQQGEYQHTEHQQSEHQQGEHQQSEYQQGEYQQGEYQQGEYQQDYHQGEYQQDYQQDYQQGQYHQGDDNQQHSSEPGVLPVSSEYQDQAQDGQQQDFSANNNTWWGNNDPNATEHQLSTEGGVQQVPQEDYEEGQFISFGAVPTIPTFGQPSVPVNNNNTDQHAFGDDDDLGMGNNSLKKDKPVTADNGAAPAAQDSETPNPAGDGSDE
ncbi:hypothetical protein BGZ46_005604, partial [Entomortierella lignicola]